MDLGVGVVGVEMGMIAQVQLQVHVHVRTRADADANADADADVDVDVDVDVDMDMDVDVGRLRCASTVAAWTSPRMRKHILDGRWTIYCHYRKPKPSPRCPTPRAPNFNVGDDAPRLTKITDPNAQPST